MKTLVLTDSKAAYFFLEEEAKLYDDNGWWADGPMWLPKECPSEEACWKVIRAGYGYMIEVETYTDGALCALLNIPAPTEEEEQCDIKERIESRLLYWAHYGAYGAMDSLWIVVKEEAI